MGMGRNNPLAQMLLALTVLIIFHNCNEYSADGGDTLSLGASLTANQTIISKNGTFELGFFSLNGTDNWYIGIWYGKIEEKTIVWVANRETPAKKRPGVLKLSRQGILGLFDAEGAPLWSVNMSNKASRAVILDSGNFVVLSDDNKFEIAWQSFDHPVDTWLPGMKIGGKKKLVCWKNSFDPAPGYFSFEQDPSGIKQAVLIWNNSVQYWESGVWDGKRFSHIPAMLLSGLFNYSIEDTSSGFYTSYALTPANGNHTLKRFVLHKSGGFQGFTFLDNNEWSIYWSQPGDQCAVYNVCGAYGICNSNNIQFCSCVEGFIPRDNRSWSLQDWSSSGCVRQSPLNCDAENGSTDGFVVSGATLPDNQAYSFPATTKKDCEKACFHNCSCTAFAFNPPSGACQIWSGDLPSMHNTPSQSNSNVLVRVAASALPKSDPPSSSKLKITPSIVGAGLGIVSAFAIAFGILSVVKWHRNRLRLMERYADSSNSFLRMFSYRELKIATSNFRFKLGSGGFGSVFKGSLTDGTLVAVKKLEGGSGQEEKQFRAEINSLGSIQHVNLVRLRGFCAKGSERLLVYDYMPNGSLNSVLFSGNSESKQKLLDWKTRFQIALGTARGILYLHEECRECIIHNDVKPENILLDSELYPKLADFGMAKLVGRDFSRVLTTMRGTRGYLAPEWLSGLPITPKVDVYSFGMTLLEIISGRRNLDMSVQESDKHYFPLWAAAQIEQGNTNSILEEYVAFGEEEDAEEVKRAIAVGLLCIEENENVRPSMGQVVWMLEGKMEPPTPQIPSDSDVVVFTSSIISGNGF